MIVDGILMSGRFSIGWNFHPARQVKTFGFGISFADDRWMALVGPLTIIWIHQ